MHARLMRSESAGVLSQLEPPPWVVTRGERWLARSLCSGLTFADTLLVKHNSIFSSLWPPYMPDCSFIYAWESGRPFIRPTIFVGQAGSAPPPPGPARLPNPWSFGGPASDTDGSYRLGFEVRTLRLGSIVLMPKLPSFLQGSPVQL